MMVSSLSVLDCIAAATAAAGTVPFKLTAASVLSFATQAVLVVAAVISLVRWRWSATGLVLFLFKAHLPVVFDYWVDAFAPLTGNAALERWHLFIQISNLVTAVTLLISIRLIIKREVVGGFIEPRQAVVKKRPASRRRKVKSRQD